MACGGVIGYGRSRKKQNPGLRTYMLTSIGAALTMLVIILGVLGSWLGSLTMYGFGELVERAMNIDDKLSAKKPE